MAPAASSICYGCADSGAGDPLNITVEVLFWSESSFGVGWFCAAVKGFGDLRTFELCERWSYWRFYGVRVVGSIMGMVVFSIFYVCVVGSF